MSLKMSSTHTEDILFDHPFRDALHLTRVRDTVVCYTVSLIG